METHSAYIILVFSDTERDDILISYGFEDELNTVVSILLCWFTTHNLKKKLIIEFVIF